MIFRRRKAGTTSAEPFRVIASRSLGAKSKLVLIEVQDQKIPASVDDKATRVLTRWEDEPAAAAPSADDTVRVPKLATCRSST